MTLLRLALRSHRTGVIATAVIGSIAGLLNSIAFVTVAGTTPEARHAFAEQMTLLGKQLSYLLPAPVGLDTMGGYLTWRNFSTVALVTAIWGLLAGTGAARGDEERGQTEAWLATGVSRARWIVTRVAGFAIAAFASVAVGMFFTDIGAIVAGDPLDIGGSILEALNIYALTLVGFGIGVVMAQLFVTRRSAASIGGVLIVALYTFNSAVRSGAQIGPIAALSPFYLFDRSTPLLPPAVAFDWAALATLLLIAAVLIAIGALAFVRRDLGSGLVRSGSGRTRVTMRPASDPLLRVPVLAIVDQQRLWTIGWAAALCALAYLLISITRTMIDSLAAIPSMQAYFTRAGLAGYSDFIGVIWFSTALLILSVLVVVQVSGWASDDAEGRLESVLASGASRARVVVERIAAVIVVVAIALTASTLVVWYAARAFDITVPVDRLVLATVLMLPVVFAFAGLGQLLVGWRPRVALIGLAAIAVYSYFVLEFAALFDWPQWVANTSVFALYGTPMTKVEWTGIVTLLAIGIFGTTGAIVTMRRRDVGA